jgi:hypothetical protein
MANQNRLKVKLFRGVVVQGATEPRGEPTYGKPGEIHEFDRWEALHLTAGDYPAGELVTAKK